MDGGGDACGIGMAYGDILHPSEIDNIIDVPVRVHGIPRNQEFLAVDRF